MAFANAVVLIFLGAACGKSEVPPPAPGTPTSQGAPVGEHEHGPGDGHDHGEEVGASDAHAGVAGAPPMATSRDVAGGAELPPDHPPLQPSTVGEITPPPPGSGVGSAALMWDAPGSWKSEPPANAMRKAQYRVPGPGGDGECVVFYFGPGQGGDPMANARRWASMFTLPDGSSAENALKTEEKKVGDVEVLMVEVAGTYDGGMAMGTAPSQPQPGYKLLGAVAEGADANWFFKFTGPAKTVDSNREAFERMLDSLRRGA